MTQAHKTPKILVVDDNNSFRSLLTDELSLTFPGVRAVESGERALGICRDVDFDVILLDIRMPDQDGLEVLTSLKSSSFDGEVIMLTGHATLDTAIGSLKLGAYDYLTKPCKLEELESIVLKAYEKRLLRTQNWKLQEIIQRQSAFPEFIGRSERLRHVLDIVTKVAATDVTVLIQGESGVGKELIARAIHYHSPRASQPFVVVDCSTLQEELLQSELFGHEEGAFTGAVALKRGLFEVADTGTLFLDEIGELSLNLQARLLRVLESSTFRRVGGDRNIHADVRILTATNQNLSAMVRERRFRDDLYYRIDVVTIQVPSLRERKEEIPKLVEHFIHTSRGRSKGEPPIVQEALEILKCYSWPGNVRELRNVIERALILAEGDPIRPQHLPDNLQPPLSRLEVSSCNPLPTLRDMELLYIRNLLKRYSGHRSRIASTLGISERSLYRKLHEYGLDKNASRS